MARNRMIKVEFWDDEKLAAISRDARLTFIALWNLSDDYGVVKGNFVWLKNKIYPYDEKLKISEFKLWINSLVKIKTIYAFNSNGEKYYYIKNFLTHQKINRPSEKRNPEPPCNILDDSLNNHGGIREDSSPKEKEKEKEKVKEKVKGLELENSSKQKPLSIIAIPLVNKTEYLIYQKDISEWQESYPAVDILQALRSLKQWNLSNPKRQKTPSGIRKHITAWLDKDQNKGGNQVGFNTGSRQTDSNLKAAKAFLERDDNE